MKWLLQNVRRRAEFALRNPRYAARAMMRELTLTDDSLHTYDHMLWECETAYPEPRHGALVLSDGALWNEAFRDFAREVREPDWRILRGVGFPVKRKA